MVSVITIDTEQPYLQFNIIYLFFLLNPIKKAAFIPVLMFRV